MLYYTIETSLQTLVSTLDATQLFIFDERGIKGINSVNETRRLETRASYALLYRLLTTHGLLPDGVRPQIAHHEHGKPYLFDYPEIRFNLSHCRRAVAAAVCTDGEVGIDIESRRRMSDGLLHKVCSDEEIATITAAADPEIEFLRFWTSKEALLKKIGTGIDRDLRPLLRPDSPILQGLTLKSIPQPEIDGYLSICY